MALKNHFIIRSILVLVLLSCYGISNAQREHGSIGFILPRDKVKLKNGDAETGKVIYSDSSKITLRKYDYSEKNIPRNAIDTIVGLSYFTYFISPSFGPLHWKGLINQRLDTFSKDAAHLNLKFGMMRKKHWAFNGELAYQGGNNFKMLHFGVGLRYYFPLDYVRKKSTYFGINYGYNIPFVNINRFFDLGWCLGYEYLIKNKYRAFAEFYRTHSKKYEPSPAAYSFLFGMRFSLEYGNYYRKLNRK